MRELGETFRAGKGLVAAIEKVQVIVQEVNQPIQKSVQLRQGVPARTTDDLQRLFLKLSGRLVQKSLAEETFVGKPPVERALADASLPRHLFHRDPGYALLPKKPPGRPKYPTPVPGRVAALALPPLEAPTVTQRPPPTYPVPL